ncbi:MAG: hypothetical protein ACOX67_03610 [Oscillospiraceae bacterium]|jgi:Mn-containing catalase
MAYLCRQIEEKRTRKIIEFLLSRKEAHNQMLRDAFHAVQDSGFHQDLGTAKAAKRYFPLSNPGPNAFAGNEAAASEHTK